MQNKINDWQLIKFFYLQHSGVNNATSIKIRLSFDWFVVWATHLPAGRIGYPPLN